MRSLDCIVFSPQIEPQSPLFLAVMQQMSQNLEIVCIKPVTSKAELNMKL